MIGTRIRNVIPVIVSVLLLSTSVPAESPPPMDFCCICDCRTFAEGALPSATVPEGGTCVDVSQVVKVNCSAACSNVFCIQAGAVQGTCSEVEGCPQAGPSDSLMAPVASAWALTALCLVLGCVGVLAMRRRPAV